MIKLAEEKDLPEILELQYAAFTPVAALMKKEVLPPLAETLEDLVKAFRDEVFLKYVFDGKIVGSVRAKLSSDGSCRIGKLIVEPAVQSYGIGGKLMQEIEILFTACEKYMLFTAAATPNTSRMYARLGYEEKYRKEMNGIEMIFMEKYVCPVPRKER